MTTARARTVRREPGDSCRCVSTENSPASSSALMLSDRLVEHDVELVGVGRAPVVAERLQPRRLVVRARERQPADLHQLRRREEHHLRRVVQQRVDQRPLLDHLIGQSRLRRGDGGGEPGGAGADNGDVACGWGIGLVTEISHRFTGAGRYSNSRLLTIATGTAGHHDGFMPRRRPGVERFAEEADLVDAGRNGDDDRSRARRARPPSSCRGPRRRRCDRTGLAPCGTRLRPRRGRASPPSSSARPSRRGSARRPCPRLISSSE